MMQAANHAPKAYQSLVLSFSHREGKSVELTWTRVEGALPSLQEMGAYIL